VSAFHVDHIIKADRRLSGRNVCTYFLIDTCKFGEAKCVYSHSRQFLPKRGWWTDPEKTAKVKGIVELAEKTAKEQRSLVQSQQKRQAPRSRPKPEASSMTGEAKSDGQKAVEAAVLINGGKEEGVSKAESKKKPSKSGKSSKQLQVKEVSTDVTAAGGENDAAKKPRGKKRTPHRNTKLSTAAKANSTQETPATQDTATPTPAPVAAVS
jgi:uncharacterized Fe-S cluster protein YjdI